MVRNKTGQGKIISLTCHCVVGLSFSVYYIKADNFILYLLFSSCCKTPITFGLYQVFFVKPQSRCWIWAALVVTTLLCFSITNVVACQQQMTNDSRHSGEEILRGMPHPTKSLQPTHSLPMLTSITSSHCTHTVSFP